MQIKNPALLGALRALGAIILIAVLHFLGDATNLSFISSPAVVSVIVIIAGALEHQIQASTGSALFGAVKVK